MNGLASIRGVMTTTDLGGDFLLNTVIFISLLSHVSQFGAGCLKTHVARMCGFIDGEVVIS